jgi:hypothetical protein
LLAQALHGDGPGADWICATWHFGDPVWILEGMFCPLALIYYINNTACQYMGKVYTSLEATAEVVSVCPVRVFVNGP